MSLDISDRRRTRPMPRTATAKTRRAARGSPLWADLSDSLRRRHLWLNLAWKDIRTRYRRTVIGPFWTVLSTAVFVAALGFVNSTLWHIDISTYLPFFCAGYISWLLFVTVVNESGPSLIAAEASIKSIGLPFSIFTFRLLSRNLIVFGHNLSVFAAVAVLFNVRPTMSMLLLPIGLALAVANYLWISLLLGMVCARFRDVIQLVTNLTMILFFVTPVFWAPDQIASVPAARFLLADANPAYHLVEVVRAPLLGQAPGPLSFVYLTAMAVGGFAVAELFLRKFYGRISYWL